MSTLVLCGLAAVAAGEPSAHRAAVRKALPVLWAGVDGHSAERTCFTCHNHGVPLVAFAAAKSKGFDVPADKLAELVGFVRDDIAGMEARLRSGQGPGPSPAGGGANNTGYMLLALAAAGHAPDAVSDALVEYTLGVRPNRDHWPNTSRRAPTEASSFTTTALAVGGLRRYAGPAHRERIERRLADARGWLSQTAPRDTEDRVFKLIGLHAAGAQVTTAADDLAATQRADGGWGQTDALASDAYATATAVYALLAAGGRTSADTAVGKGLRWLVAAQLPDGSWHVKSRSPKLQKYFETGFPHGPDQFLSCAATGWAVAALALAGD